MFFNLNKAETDLIETAKESLNIIITLKTVNKLYIYKCNHPYSTYWIIVSFI